MESSSSKTLWPETCEVGQIWTTVCLEKKTSKELMSIYGKFKVKDSFDRNLLSWSNMDHCLSGKKNIKGVNEYLWKVQVQRHFDQKHVK